MDQTILDSMDSTIDIPTQELILAASQHDTTKLKSLLKTTAASVQDPETKTTPLHAAISALEPDDDDAAKDDETATAERQKEIEAATDSVRILIENGAIWNDLDANGETPGCIAHRLGLEEIYQMIVDAGVRAEVLLSRLDEYQMLEDDDDEDEEQDEEPKQEGPETNGVAEVDVSKDNEIYLANPLSFGDTAVLDASSNGVMMSWETPLMQKHADQLAPTPGLRILNIGHGLGIIDSMFQEKQPSAHHIIEAHPAVIARMREQGWMDKPGVVVHEGRWQEVLPALIMGAGEDGQEVLFDGVFFDTFAEEYKDMREFFSEWVVQILDSEGRFGFFNGMGADRQVCYDVYTKVAEMDLYEAGFDVEWEDIDIPNLQEAGEWKGIARPYWALEKYKLPTCQFLG